MNIISNLRAITIQCAQHYHGNPLRSNLLANKMIKPGMMVLNKNVLEENAAEIIRRPTDIVQQLYRILKRMRNTFLDDSGYLLNYEALETSNTFREYLKVIAQLPNLDLKDLGVQQKTAFFINLYNALTIHGLVSFADLPKSMMDYPHFWRETVYNVGNALLSLDDILHGILRANNPKPTCTTPMYEPTHQNANISLETLDPRIHFAITCGAKSSPRFRVFSADHLDEELDCATRDYLEDQVQVNLKGQCVTFPLILHWYRKDFGSTDTQAIRWTLPFLSEDKRTSVDHLVREMDEVGGVTIQYKDYDWNVNVYRCNAESKQGTTMKQKIQDRVLGQIGLPWTQRRASFPFNV